MVQETQRPDKPVCGGRSRENWARREELRAHPESQLAERENNWVLNLRAHPDPGGGALDKPSRSRFCRLKMSEARTVTPQTSR